MKNIAWEVYIDELNELHISSGHIDKDNLKRASSEKNCNVTQVIIIIFSKNCEFCITKVGRIKKGRVVKPIVLSWYYRRWDFQIYSV